MNVLLITVDIEALGGIASYYRILKGKFHLRVDYFIVGTRQAYKSKIKNIVRFFGDYFRFCRTVNRYDVVLINTSLVVKSILRDTIFILLAKLFSKKIVVFFHGWNQTVATIIEKFCLGLFKLCLFTPEALIVLSSEINDKLVDWGYKKSIYLLTAVLDDSFIFNCQEIKYHNTEKLTVLFLTRIEVQKGIYEAIDAYGILKQKYPGLNMIVAGDGREYANVVEYVESKALKDIRFVGYVRDELKKKTFLESDIYIFPTYSEGMPISLIEAMACGLCIVTRPVGGIKDFFRDGEMGFITESKDPHILAELMERLIIDRAQRIKMGMFNSQYAKDHFAASKVVHKLENILLNSHQLN